MHVLWTNRKKEEYDDGTERVIVHELYSGALELNGSGNAEFI